MSPLIVGLLFDSSEVCSASFAERRVCLLPIISSQLNKKFSNAFRNDLHRDFADSFLHNLALEVVVLVPFSPEGKNVASLSHSAVKKELDPNNKKICKSKMANRSLSKRQNKWAIDLTSR